MVGGKLEIGEHPQQAIVREVEEETGLKVKFVRFRGVVNEILYKDKKPQTQFVIWVCETRSKTNNARETYEGEIKWFTKKELIKNQKKMIPSDFAMISEFFLKNKPTLAMHKSHVQQNGKTYTLKYFGKIDVLTHG